MDVRHRAARGEPVRRALEGHACTSEILPEYGTLPAPRLSQFDQARALANHLNAKIDAVVKQAAASAGGQGKIFFALPDQAAWTNHQAWSSESWVFKNDTWVHPNVEGHKQLATAVRIAMCRDYQHWCGSPPRWCGPAAHSRSFSRNSREIPLRPVVLKRRAPRRQPRSSSPGSAGRTSTSGPVTATTAIKNPGG